MASRTFEQMVGRRFGRLVVLSPGMAKGRRLTWVCRCDCGATTGSILGKSLRNGDTRSCGCLHKEQNITHGMSHTAIYKRWASMLQRCRDKNHVSYPNYGGRGIDVCRRWEKFENFLADMGEPPPGTSLDRVDNDGPYEPGNVRWATLSEQRNNRRPRRALRNSKKTKSSAA